MACSLAAPLPACLLRQEEKAQREAAEAKAGELQRSMEARLAQASAAGAAAVAAEVARRHAMEAELAATRQQVAASAESASAAQQQLSADAAEVRGKLTAVERQKAELEVRPLAVGRQCTALAVTSAVMPSQHTLQSSFAPALQAKAQAEKQDLLSRLNNAVAQRNAAREEALMLEAKLKQMQEDVESGRLQPAGGMAAAAAAAAAAGMATPPGGATGMTDEGMMDRMRRFMQQIPGSSPMRDGTPLATPSGECTLLALLCWLAGWLGWAACASVSAEP